MRPRGIAWISLPAVALALSLSACGGASSGASSTPSDPGAAGLVPSSWLLASYADASGTQVPAVPGTDGAPLSLAADGTFAGSTGCNRFSGTYTQDGSNLSLVLGPMTLMACPNDVAAQESAVVAALPAVASFAIDGNLTLMNAEGATVLVYAPGLAGLAATSWTATGVNNGKEAVVSTAATGAVTMVFGDGESVSGSGGCNSYTGTYEATPDGGLTFGQIVATARACADPDVDATEQAFFAALPKVTSYRIDGTQLTLVDSTGATQVSLVLAP